MAKPRIFITRRIPRPGIDLLLDACEVEINPEDRPLTREELLTAARDADGIIPLLTDRIDAEFFDAAPRIRGVANYAVGFDNIDLPEATRRRIPVSNTPDVLTNATAELAWALLLAVARRVVESDTVMRSGRWPGWGPLQFIGADVTGKTLGIVGGGRIGTAMARMSRGFDMPLLYTGRRPNPDLDGLGARLTDFPTLLAESDFVSIHVPLTPETRHLFDRNAFRQMKPTAFLINTSRGPVVKESDLVAALQAGEIAGAGLDVYECEPRMSPELGEMPNVVCTPHVGSGTVSSRTGMATTAARNLLAMLRGERPPNCLNPDIYDG